ncbi:MULTISPECIES: sporulation protein YunB [Lysinibacillus]|uniref:Sporulation protein YunB n=4 Tax=Lysinibacillus TaxID=400634 RepID=A0AAJ4ZY01_LYSSH|nr:MULTISPECIES: sporulation protein YunB [Lysinibacillus]MCS1382842.1 sporulation protein YunB [Lysinibacillus sphaericus]MED4546037.1 sporulation protein YunB [Lysinibacillus sphaericus]GEC83034.1 sporulation protein YunB [Lysinibacillus sphaericus]SUV18546.1 sporulation protein YunB [Lysinibacillus sphaericus]
MFFPRKRMKLRTNHKRGMQLNRLTLLIVASIICIALFLYFLNERLKPTYLEYAEVQTNKIASYVVSKAINSRTSNVLDVNDIIEDVPSGTSVTTKFNTEIINRVRAETLELVKMYLEQAEHGELSHLPDLDNVEYDVNKIQQGDGIVFFVPLAQAADIPLLGNLGPKIPIRFHVIGNVHSNVTADIREFGINSAYVEVGIHIEVNVQIIVPFASKSTTVSQDIPVAMGLTRGPVPNIYTNGTDAVQPSIEVPVPYQ